MNRLRLRGLGTRRYQLDPRLSATLPTARALQARRQLANSDKSAVLFEQIIAADPGFAPAHAGLASALGAFSTSNPTAKNCHQIRACGLLPCARSLSIRFWPTPIQPWEVYARDHDWTNARASFTKAIELEPTLTTAHTDFVLTVLLPLGHAAEALHVLTTRCAPIRCRWMSGA